MVAKNLRQISTALLLTGLGGTAALAQGSVPTPASAPAPMAAPAMSATLAANPNPASFNLDVPGFDWLLGKVYVTGAFSAMEMYQTSPHKVPGDREFYPDGTNAQLVIQKTDGWFQYYIQAGEYSFPTLGTGYTKASNATNTFGVFPEAYAKIVLSDNFNVIGGSLPTLIGDEYNFTFQNINVERGLLWNQEPAVSPGVQANYSDGAFSASLSLNAGYYSTVLNSLSGLVSYGFNGGADTLAFAGAGSLGNILKPNAGTTNWQNNSSIYNLIYTHTSGAWTISPYIQYLSVPKNLAAGIANGATSVGGAILAAYAFNDNWKLGGRVEYLTTTKGNNLGLYGPGSNAVTFTITPTWQYKVLFVRPEISYVSVGSGTPGAELGPAFKSTDQFRALLEAGIVF